MKRTAASDLVRSAMIRRKPVSWFCRLLKGDQDYIMEIIRAMKLQGVTSFHSVSICIRKELNLNIGLTTIKTTLRELYDAKAQSKRASGRSR